MTEKLSDRLDREARAWAEWNAEHPNDQSPSTEELLREAAALARRVEGAVHGYVDGFGSIHAAGIESDYHGQRVRLVPVEGGA